jgi:hypothetical protein
MTSLWWKPALLSSIFPTLLRRLFVQYKRPLIARVFARMHTSAKNITTRLVSTCIATSPSQSWDALAARDSNLKVGAGNCGKLENVFGLALLFCVV